jgi:hypothetical protein
LLVVAVKTRESFYGSLFLSLGEFQVCKAVEETARYVLSQERNFESCPADRLSLHECKLGRQKIADEPAKGFAPNHNFPSLLKIP